MTRVVWATVLIAMTLAALFLMPFPVFVILLEIVLILAAREYFNIARQHNVDGYLITYILLVAAPWIWGYFPDYLAAFLMASVLVLILWAVLVTKVLDRSLPSITSNVFVFFYLGLPAGIAATYHPNAMAGGSNGLRPFELLLVFVAIWSSDIAAYYVGKAIGRHRITPVISPNKSLEGYIGGIVTPAFATVLLGYWALPGISLYWLATMGALLGAVGTLGDLFESLLKRSSGVKDSSIILPGHGGMLDRIDSLLLGLPVYFLLSSISRAPF